MILLVQSYPGGNDAFSRHYPFFQKAGANRIVGIGTNDMGCTFPCESVVIGKNSYIDGSHLPERLIDTLKFGLQQGEEHICVCEFDCVFFASLPVQKMEHVIAATLSGHSTWGSRANKFYHPPWLFHHETAQRFVTCGEEAIKEGVCYRNRGEASSPESSPDVFLGFVSEKYNIPIHENLWPEYSRNDLTLPGHLDEAREAYRNGATCIHGIKTERELTYILS